MLYLQSKGHGFDFWSGHYQLITKVDGWLHLGTGKPCRN